MRILIYTLTLVLALANTSTVIHDSVDVAGETPHHGHGEIAEHNHTGDSHEGHGAFNHHCCHAHAHLYLATPLQIPSADDAKVLWHASRAPSPYLIGFAPPVPPPKA